MKFRYTWAGQVLSVVLTHIEMSFLFFFVWLLALGLLEKKVFGDIYTVVSVLTYFFALYGVSESIYRDDKKTYTKLSPFWYKGAILSILPILLNLIFATLIMFVWKKYSEGGALQNAGAIVINVIGVFWVSPFQKLVQFEKGMVDIVSYLVIVIVPFIACFFGYFAGVKGFDISSKFRFLMYEKKKKK